MDNEASLVDATMAGDTQAFEELINRHEQRIFRLAQNITKNEADAEEVVQDSFMRVFAHLDGFQRQSKFSTWLTRIAINESLMKIRRRRPGEVSLDMPVDIDDREVFQSLPITGPTPEQNCSCQEQQDLVGRMMGYIKPKYRYPLQLHLQEDLSYTEIARLMGISSAAAKSRIYRARLDLRKALDAVSSLGKALTPSSRPRPSPKAKADTRIT
jgi:RNA polymerase sigma-70 factor (ECF subfamily)